MCDEHLLLPAYKTPGDEDQSILKTIKGTALVTALDLTLEPCKRYGINAQFRSGPGTNWEPVVAQVEAVPGSKTP